MKIFGRKLPSKRDVDHPHELIYLILLRFGTSKSRNTKWNVDTIIL